MRALWLLPLIVVAGCKKTDELYCCTDQAACAGGIVNCGDGERCEQAIHTCVDDIGMPCAMSSECAPDPTRPFCVDEACQATCDGDQSCDGAVGADGLPYCLNGTCVACSVATQATDCAPTTPVCDDGVCSACDHDDDCGADGVCLLSGSCAATNRILYAAPAGSGMACSAASKCSIGEALNQVSMMKDIVKLDAGPYVINPRPSQFDIGEDVIISGYGAIIDLQIVDSEVFQISSADVTLVGLTVQDGNGVVGDGIVCDSGGSLVVHRVTVVNNDQIGIRATVCDLTVTQSTVVRNLGGGIQTSGALGYSITNTFVTRNGETSSSAFGGLDLRSTAAGNELRFNTIADNNADSEPGGFLCSGPQATVDNNIFARNEVNGGNQIQPGCGIGNSMVSDSVTEFEFASPESTPYDYHLLDGSDAIDAATGTIDVDVDGERRPRGTNPDFGADEFYP